MRYLVVDETSMLKEVISRSTLDRLMQGAPYLPRVDVRQVEGIPGKLGRTVCLSLHKEAVLVACVVELSQYRASRG